MKIYKMYRDGKLIKTGTSLELAKYLIFNENVDKSLKRVRTMIQKNKQACGFRFHPLESVKEISFDSNMNRRSVREKKKEFKYERGCFDPHKDMNSFILNYNR